MHLADQGLNPLGAFQFEQIMLAYGFQFAHHRIITPLTIAADKGRLAIIG